MAEMDHLPVEESTETELNEAESANEAPQQRSNHIDEELRKLKNQNAYYKRQLDSLKKRDEEASHQHAATAKVIEEARSLRDVLDRRAIAAELKAQAQAAGLMYPDLLKLVERGSVKVSDDGEVTGAKEAVEALKSKMPNVFSAPKTTFAGYDLPESSLIDVSGYKDLSTMSPEDQKAALANIDF